MQSQINRLFADEAIAVLHFDQFRL